MQSIKNRLICRKIFADTSAAAWRSYAGPADLNQRALQSQRPWLHPRYPFLPGAETPLEAVYRDGNTLSRNAGDWGIWRTTDNL